jgi:hypothetical protein
MRPELQSLLRAHADSVAGVLLLEVHPEAATIEVNVRAASETGRKR